MAAAEEQNNIVPLPERIMKKLLGGESAADIQRSNLIELSDAMAEAFNKAGAIEPPLDPLGLSRLVSMSGTLRPLVDTMAVCVHGFGYHFEPVIDLDASDAIDRVRAAMIIEAELKAEKEAGNDEELEPVDEPSDEDVKARIESLRQQMRREKAKLEAFFRNCNTKFTFTRISRKAQIDKESTGYFAIEARRDGRGRLSRLTYAPSWTFRALPLSKSVEVDSRVRASDISYQTIREPVRYRRFVQIYENSRVFFKEFGDRRVMSAKTGRYYDDVKALQQEEGEEAVEATEILWSSLDSSESDVYGLIRWSGCIPGVIGSREQAEVNLLFFRSKAIPPMVITVAGGHLRKGVRERLEKLIENEIKGVENFHKIIVLEVEATKPKAGVAGMAGQDKVTIELRPLIDSIFKDALWRGYAADNRNELGESFRIPPMLRGDTQKLNRATAKIARETTEQLVFSPERRDFEFDIDRTIFVDLGIMLWQFKLNAPESTDAEQLVTFITKLLEGALTVNESRRRLSAVLGIELPPLDAEWARMPMKFALAGLPAEPLPEDTDDADSGDEDESGSTQGEEDEEKGEIADVIKMRVSPQEFQEMFETDPA